MEGTQVVKQSQNKKGGILKSRPLANLFGVTFFNWGQSKINQLKDKACHASTTHKQLPGPAFRQRRQVYDPQ